MSLQSISGKRVLTLGPALAGLAAGPLAGARLEAAGLDRLIGIGAADADLILIDADAWSPQALAASIQALSFCTAPPPVLLVGTHLPAAVVRTLLRLERSDVLDAPYAPEILGAVIATLLEAPAPIAQPVAPPQAAEVARCWAVIGAVGG